MRIALIGAGDAGRHHAKALLELAGRVGAAGSGAEGPRGLIDGVEWTALGVRDQAPADFPLGPSTRVCSVAEAIAASDAVILATPDGLHRAHAEQVLAAGKHVLVEKPLALSVADAEAVVAAARAADRVLAVGYHLRHHAGHERIRRERSGTLRTIHLRWAWPDPAIAGWRAKGQGARWWSLAALGTHAIDLALWLADDRVVDVASVKSMVGGIDHAAEVSLRFANGALAHISCAITHRAIPTLSIAGDAGEVHCVRTLGARGGGAIDGVELVAENPYLRQLRAFVRRCAGDGERIDRDAVANLEVLERA